MHTLGKLAGVLKQRKQRCKFLDRLTVLSVKPGVKDGHDLGVSPEGESKSVKFDY